MKIILSILIGLIILSIYRLFIGPTLWDRLLALNLVSSKIIMSIVVLAVINQQEMFLDVALIYAIIGFIGIVYMAIFVHKKGLIK